MPLQDGEKWHKLSCVDGECEDCSVLDLAGNFSIQELQQDIVWQKWEKDSTNESNCKVVIQKKHGTLQTMIQEFETELRAFRPHLHTALWQQHQFSKITTDVPPRTAILVMDYSENYTCEVQGAIQSYHWGRSQVGLFPCIAYYRCAEDDQICREAIDIVTDEKTKDGHSVAHFSRLIIDHLTKKRHLNIEELLSSQTGAAHNSNREFPLQIFHMGLMMEE